MHLISIRSDFRLAAVIFALCFVAVVQENARSSEQSKLYVQETIREDDADTQKPKTAP